MAQGLRAIFGDALCVAAAEEFPGTTTDWLFPDMDKSTVDWTKRLLARAVASGEPLLKVDPDTTFHSVPPPPPDCDIAGDFRRSTVGWIWFGAYQYFTTLALQKFLSDPEYSGPCKFQDVALTQSARRTGLRAFNMPEVNGWVLPKHPPVAVMHRSRGSIQRLPPGFVDLRR